MVAVKQYDDERAFLHELLAATSIPRSAQCKVLPVFGMCSWSHGERGTELCLVTDFAGLHCSILFERGECWKIKQISVALGP